MDAPRILNCISDKHRSVYGTNLCVGNINLISRDTYTAEFVSKINASQESLSFLMIETAENVFIIDHKNMSYAWNFKSKLII